MPTRPPNGLREIEEAKRLSAGIRGSAAVCLTETVNHGLAALARCIDSAEGHDEHSAIMACFRHVLDCVDGVGELVEEACDGPAQLILRSAFEGWVSLQYLLKEDTERRAHAWLVCYIERRRTWYQRLAPGSETGKKLRQVETEQLGMSILGAITDEKVAKQLKKFDRLRAKPLWREAYAEWDRLRTPRHEGGRPRRPVWHAFYDGPTSIEALASMFGQMHLYEVMYRDWSNRIHAGDLLSGLRGKDGGLSINGLRQSGELANWATFAVTIGVSSIREMLFYYRPAEIAGGGFRRWYLREIKPGFSKFCPIGAEGLVPKGPHRMKGARG